MGALFGHTGKKLIKSLGMLASCTCCDVESRKGLPELRSSLMPQSFYTITLKLISCAFECFDSKSSTVH